jgi:type I site-specific restriction endonuclease
MISESEWLTRKKRIDSRLKAVGWKIAKHFDGIV